MNKCNKNLFLSECARLPKKNSDYFLIRNTFKRVCGRIHTSQRAVLQPDSTEFSHVVLLIYKAIITDSFIHITFCNYPKLK